MWIGEITQRHLHLFFKWDKAFMPCLISTPLNKQAVKKNMGLKTHSVWFAFVWAAPPILFDCHRGFAETFLNEPYDDVSQSRKHALPLSPSRSLGGDDDDDDDGTGQMRAEGSDGKTNSVF